MTTTETHGLTWYRVTSSNLREIAFNEETGRLYIEFKDGGVYAYDGADDGLFVGLLNAISPGKFFAEHIRSLPTRKL